MYVVDSNIAVIVIVSFYMPNFVLTIVKPLDFRKEKKFDD